MQEKTVEDKLLAVVEEHRLSTGIQINSISISYPLPKIGSPKIVGLSTTKMALPTKERSNP